MVDHSTITDSSRQESLAAEPIPKSVEGPVCDIAEPNPKKDIYGVYAEPVDPEEIRKLNIEARNLPPNVKVVLLSKLREYKSDLNNLKKPYMMNYWSWEWPMLLQYDNQAISYRMSADQRGRLMMSTERLNKSSDRVRDSRRTMLETEELGVSLLQDLHQQRQSLLHAHGTVRFYTLLNQTLFHK
ncbi:putative vesicle transport v-SNARE domain superfamily protein [Helianthus anomalus]